VIASNGVGSDVVLAVAGTGLVRQATCPGPTDRGSTQVVGQQLLAVAAVPVCPRTGHGGPVGIVLRISPLDASYLRPRYQGEPSVALAFVGPNGLLAEVGPQPPSVSLVGLARTVLGNGSSATAVTKNRYLAAYPIRTSDKTTVATLSVSEPTSTLISTRDRLYRTLFLIALGGTLLAFGLAAVIGDRITAGLRRLTYTARSIQRGEIGQRAEIGGEDEVGVLGAAFDSMAASIEEKTGALQVAADDETRLRNRLEAVVAGMGDALVAIDSDGRITDFNQAAEELTGLSAARARGRPVDDVLVLVNEDGTSLGPRLRTPSPSRWGVLATAVQNGGVEVPVAVSAGALRGPFDEVTGSVLVLRDLRREREVEQMKTEFLSRIGHELRTPLTSIMGYADILRRRAVDPARATIWHEEILEAAKRLLRVVEMLEFFASSGAGRVLLRPERLHVRSLVDGVAQTWADRLPESHTLVHRVARHTADIQGDRRWLALAIDELIDNAVKFSPEGGRVAVTALSVAADGNRDGREPHVEISVIDRGKGMTREEQATAFSEFVQGDSSDTRRFGGLGLGLSLVQRVVEGHGGTVRCSSSPGEGSTFTIVLPAVAAAESINADSIEHAASRAGLRP
jgi:PAS domain S-box-containing protein